MTALFLLFGNLPDNHHEYQFLLRRWYAMLRYKCRACGISHIGFCSSKLLILSLSRPYHLDTKTYCTECQSHVQLPDACRSDGSLQQLVMMLKASLQPHIARSMHAAAAGKQRNAALRNTGRKPSAAACMLTYGHVSAVSRTTSENHCTSVVRGFPCSFVPASPVYSAPNALLQVLTGLGQPEGTPDMVDPDLPVPAMQCSRGTAHGTVCQASLSR